MYVSVQGISIGLAFLLRAHIELGAAIIGCIKCKNRRVPFALAIDIEIQNVPFYILLSTISNYSLLLVVHVLYKCVIVYLEIGPILCLDLMMMPAIGPHKWYTANEMKRKEMQICCDRLRNAKKSRAEPCLKGISNFTIILYQHAVHNN